jgi:hypothetical protein
VSTIHLIGAKLSDGRRFRLFGQVSDRDFQRDCSPLPPGWIAWHVDESELVGDGSARVQELKKVPVAESPSLQRALRSIAVGVSADEFVANLHSLCQLEIPNESR